MLLDILKQHGVYYVEMDYPNNTHKEYVKGTVEEVYNAFKEAIESEHPRSNLSPQQKKEVAKIIEDYYNKKNPVFR